MMTSRPPASEDDIRQKISTENIRSNLVRSGLVLAAWELIQGEVVAKVRDFYCTGFNEKREWTYSPEYKTKVLDRHKYPFEASLLWLIESGAIDEKEAETVRTFREYRNKVGHEMPRILVEIGHDINLDRIRELRDVIRALGQFWWQIEVDTNPDVFEPDTQGATSYAGVEMLLNHLIAVAEVGYAASQ